MKADDDAVRAVLLPGEVVVTSHDVGAWHGGVLRTLNQAKRADHVHPGWVEDPDEEPDPPDPLTAPWESLVEKED